MITKYKTRKHSTRRRQEAIGTGPALSLVIKHIWITARSPPAGLAPHPDGGALLPCSKRSCQAAKQLLGAGGRWGEGRRRGGAGQDGVGLAVEATAGTYASLQVTEPNMMLFRSPPAKQQAESRIAPLWGLLVEEPLAVPAAHRSHHFNSNAHMGAQGWAASCLRPSSEFIMIEGRFELEGPDSQLGLFACMLNQ